jgi:hypothetical protein
MEEGYIEGAAPKGLKVPRFGNTLEKTIVRGLIRALVKQGFKVHSIAVDGEGYVKTPSERAAMCEIFEWDAYVTLRFTRGDDDSELFGVLLVQGNRDDIISDWTYDSEGTASEPKPGTFAHVVNTYTDKLSNERS